VGEIDLFLFFVPFVEGEVDDPAEAEGILFDDIQLLADAGARGTRQLGGLFFLAGGKNAPSLGPRPSESQSAAILSSPWFLAIGPPKTPSLRVA